MTPASIVAVALPPVLLLLGLLLIAFRDSFFRSLESEQGDEESSEGSPAPRKGIWVFASLLAIVLVIALLTLGGPVKTLRFVEIVVVVVVVLAVERGRRRASGAGD
jgi:hypothetical protein